MNIQTQLVITLQAHFFLDPEGYKIRLPNMHSAVSFPQTTQGHSIKVSGAYANNLFPQKLQSLGGGGGQSSVWKIASEKAI